MKLVSLNIYAGIYLEKSLEHLARIGPDVLCLQEAHADDIETIRRRLGFSYHVFVPSVRVEGPNRYGFREGEIGLCILSKTELTHGQVDYYHRPGEDVPVFDQDQGNHCDRALVSAEVETPEGRIRVSTTHFTWTHDGKASEMQRAHVAELAELIQARNLDVLCGDFNSPKGSEIMAHISDLMDDHMPTGVDTTIDQELHRVGGLKLVIDNVFTRRGLAQVDLQVQAGMSDHLGLIATFLFDGTRERSPLREPPVVRVPIEGPEEEDDICLPSSRPDHELSP